MANEQNGSFKLPKLSTVQLINLCIGIIGIQFAWSMQIALSSRVLEPLGADPFLFGVIWCAGPITGLLVQPIVGAISDRTWTRIGRRRPFLLLGAILGGIALILFPLAPTLLLAAIMIWIIDACVNISQGPYRALVPDVAPPEQHAVANSYLNFAFGAGSVIALGVAPLLRLFDISMTVTQQYFMAALALILFIVYTSLTIKEYARSSKKQDGNTEQAEQSQQTEQKEEKRSILESFKLFFTCNREIHKICGVQFLTWMGVMCMFIYLTPFIVHNIYHVPDLSTKEFKAQETIHDQFNEIRDKFDPETKLLLTSNKMASNIITQTGLSQVNFEQVVKDDLNKLSKPEAIQLEVNIKVETNKYREINNQLDMLLSNFAGSKTILESDVNPRLQELAKNFMPDKVISGRLLKLNDNLNSAFKDYVYQKNLVELKMLLIQYPFFLNPELRSKMNFAIHNIEVEKELAVLDTEMVKVNNKVQKYVAYGRDDKLMFDDDKFSDVLTFPGTVEKFYRIYTVTQLKKLDLEATNTAQKALVAFNFIPLLLSIPIGYLCTKLGKKPIYSVTLGFLAVAFFFAPFLTTPLHAIIMMACAGVAWATILSIPFAFMCDYIPEGEEGSLMGIFNMFIAGPQLISALGVGYLIRHTPMATELGMSHNWSIAFVVASVSVFCAIIALQFVKEKNPGLGSCSVGGGGGH